MGRYKVNSQGDCEWVANDDGPDQCQPGAAPPPPPPPPAPPAAPAPIPGRYKFDEHGNCVWSATDIGPDQCQPGAAPQSRPKYTIDPTPDYGTGPFSPIGAIVSLNVVAADAQTGAAIPGLTVTIAPEWGNGHTRTTDGGGFANFGVQNGADEFVQVFGLGYLVASLSVHIAGDTTIHPMLTRPGPSGTPTPTPTPGGPKPTPTPGGPGGNGDPGGSGNPGGGGRSTTSTIVPGVIELTTGPLSHPPSAPIPPAAYRVVDGIPRLVDTTSGDFQRVPVVGGIIDTIVTIFGFFKGLFGGGGPESQPVDLATYVDQLRNFTVQAIEALVLRSETGGAVDAGSTNVLGKILSALGGLINAVAGLLGRASSAIKDWLKPLTDLLKKVSDAIRRIYDKWLRPLLAVIDTIRGVLRILEFLHVPFAQAIDDALGKLERKLTAPILQLLAYVNQINGVLDKIIGLDGLLQRVTLLRSLVAHAKATSNIWWNSHTKKDAGVGDLTVTPADAPPTGAEVLEIGRQFFVEDGGPLAESVARANAFVMEMFP